MRIGGLPGDRIVLHLGIERGIDAPWMGRQRSKTGGELDDSYPTRGERIADGAVQDHIGAPKFVRPTA